MIPKECKRLAEVDFPIAVVSAHAAREKSIRHGHPSTLHLWWARRPLASSRAVLMALLLPDPCDPHCPERFKKQALEIVSEVRRKPESDEELQKALLWFIGSFASWDLARDKTYLRVGRNLVKAAYPEEPPQVVDPFAGGGSIPLEALRIGCDAAASDLNPVACLILKVMLEESPRRGPNLAEELRRVGARIKAQVEEELTELYPKDPDGATPIAYLWARTVKCESPRCGAEIPLVRSFWLCRKPKRLRALRYSINHYTHATSQIDFEIFEPRNNEQVQSGTVNRAKATCPACQTILPPERVRTQLAEQRGGANTIFDNDGNRTGGARLLAVVTIKAGETGRRYRLADSEDYGVVWRCESDLRNYADDLISLGLASLPNEPLPPIGTLGFRVQRYGMISWGDVFSSRQKLALATICREIRRSDQMKRPLALVVGKLIDLANSICRWEPVAECPRNVFAAGRVRPAWDFAEGVPISESSGSFGKCLENLLAGLRSVGPLTMPGTCEVAAAQDSPLPDRAASIWFTDPPYYDAYPYADLADAFFVWQKRVLGGDPFFKDPFDPDNTLTPKRLEVVQDESRVVNGRRKDRDFFEAEMALAFREGRRVLSDDGIACIVFAHQTTEGWEALISGMIAGNLTVSSSWPIATEQKHRLRAKDSAALATSVHLVCRPRPKDAPVGDWADVLRELPTRVEAWMEHLQSEGVRGADLVFACIGPALEVFSRYSMVETAEGREVGLPEYLEKVWEVVGRAALSQVLGIAEGAVNGTAAAALEDDARLSALFLWTFESTKIVDNGEGKKPVEDEEAAFKKKGARLSLPFDVVRRIAQPLGIHLPDWEDRIIQTEKGIVRLLPIAERAKQLFGKEGAQAVADQLEAEPAAAQLALFPQPATAPHLRTRGRRKKTRLHVGDDDLESRQEATTLDRVHAAMLLQASGRANALRALLKAEQQRGPEFIRLANGLSALYPKGTEERRLVEAMLQAVPR